MTNIRYIVIDFFVGDIWKIYQVTTNPKHTQVWIKHLFKRNDLFIGTGTTTPQIEALMDRAANWARWRWRLGAPP